MRYSKLFGKTVRTAPGDAATISHKLLYQAGFIRESSAGRYYFLPLGMKVYRKIMEIIKEEMDKAGAQEVLAPVMHPLELWKETNRTKQTGFELTVVTDRREAQFALGGTAEEMMVDLVRKFQITYRDLPFNIYQFSQKFRDELRARGGLLRVREFMMKDAYSFHRDEKDFKKEYKKMRDTYSNIFKRLGLNTIVVESDNGYIGGDYCHEFVVESDIGESKFLVTKDGTYAAHEDVCKFTKDKKNLKEELKIMKKVGVKRGTTMEDGVKLHKMPLWQQIKDVLYVDENGRYILAIIRGDYDVNETKLKHICKAVELRHATGEEIRKVIHSEPGFISPVGIKDKLEDKVKLVVVADDSLRTVRNTYGGANSKYQDMLNMNIDRDYKSDLEGDIAKAAEGFETEDGKQLIGKKGIEVGNIFQLGYHYSDRMRDATYIDEAGKPQKFYMGCYGIGVGRTMAAIVEKYNDERGIIWPRQIAPFSIYLVTLGKDPVLKEKADNLYELLVEKDIDVLFDDRVEASAGVKFADFDLIGVPVRLVISERTGDKVEVKMRQEKETKLMSIEDVIKIFG